MHRSDTQGAEVGPTGSSLVIEVTETDDCVRFEVAGKLDTTTAAELERQLMDVFNASHRLVELDMAGLTFMDASGRDVLIASMRAAPDRFVPIAASAAAERVLVHTVVGLLLPKHDAE